MTVRLMITAAGGALSCQTIAYAKASARYTIEVLAVDMADTALGRYAADHFATVPHGASDGYVDRICALVADYGIDLVLPCSDEEALALAAERARLEALGSTLACADIETLRVMGDKSRAYRTLAAHGLPAPAFRLAETPAALAAATEAFQAERGAFVVKPPAGSRGGRDTIIVHGGVAGARPYSGGRELEMDYDTFRREFLAAAAGRLPALVCERLVPPAYDVDVLARDGRALRAVPRRRLNPAGVPYRGYVVEDRPDLVALAAATAEALALSWLYDFDVMQTLDGRPAILELNPRPSGSFATSIAAGVPLIDDLVALAKGEPLSDAGPLPSALTVVPQTMLKVIAA
ncbi:MAG TPA: ATP-grasp domain-containing protein [Alphaproteobacteria bacterium]